MDRMQIEGRVDALKRMLGAAGVAIAAAALTGTASAQSADGWQAYTYWGSPTVIASKGFRRMVDEIEAASGGALKIKFNLGGTLSIAANNIGNAVGDDIIQLADDAFFTGAMPIGGMPSLPLLAGTVDDVHKVMSIIRPAVEREYGRKGVTVLGYYVYPPQVFWFRDRVESLAQVKGRKVRVISAEQGDLIRRLGASPVQIGSAEVPAALERGVVDGILTASAGGIAAWKELLKSSYGLQVNYVPAFIIVNSDRFRKLSPDVQAKVRDIIARNTAAQTVELQKDDVELRQKFGSEGITMFPARAEDIAQAQALAREGWEAWAKTRGAEAADLLGKARSALGR